MSVAWIIFVAYVLWPALAVGVAVGFLYGNRHKIDGWVQSFAKARIEAKLGTKVTCETFKIHHSGSIRSVTGFTATGVEIANDPRGVFNAPYFARIGKIDITTDGILGLLSIPGMARFGPYVREVRMGFTTRAIETIEVADVELCVEDGVDMETETTISNAAWIDGVKQKKRDKRERIILDQKEFIRQWRARWKKRSQSEVETAIDEDSDSDHEHEHHDDPDNINDHDHAHELHKVGGSTSSLDEFVGPVPHGALARFKRLAKTVRTAKDLPLKERIAAAHNLKHAFKEADKQEKVVAKLAKARQHDMSMAMWRIGKFTVRNSRFVINGTEMRLDKGWSMHAFVGSFSQLKHKLSKGLIKATLGQTISHRRSHAVEKVSSAVNLKLGAAKQKVVSLRDKVKSRFHKKSAATSKTSTVGDDEDSDSWV